MATPQTDLREGTKGAAVQGASRRFESTVSPKARGDRKGPTCFPGQWVWKASQEVPISGCNFTLPTAQHSPPLGAIHISTVEQ